MIVESFILGVVLYSGYKTWKAQDSQKSHDLLREQRHASQSKLTPSTNKSLGLTGAKAKSQQAEQNPPIISNQSTLKYEIASSAVATGLATIGLISAPIAYTSIPFIIYASRTTFQTAWQLLKRGKIDIESLISGALVGAMLLRHLFVAGFLLLLYRISNYLTLRVITDSRQHLIDIFQHTPESVLVLVDEIEISIPFQQIQTGDILVVRAGETIPADGCIISGMAGVDQHILTGEAIPVEKGPGETVFAMALVLSGKIYVQVEQAGADSSAAKITKILNRTADFKSNTMLRAEAFSRQLVNPTLLASAVAWPILGISSAIAVLFAHPKDRLSMVAPISILKHLRLCSEQGVLIKDGRSLELLNQVDTIVFDKTGTLTEEQPHVGNIYCFSTYTEKEVLRYAVIAEHQQSHPLARAILAEAAHRNIEILEPEHSEYKLGYGLTVQLLGQTIRVGSIRLMESEGIRLSEEQYTIQARSQTEGYALVIVAVNDQVIGAIELLPTVRPEARNIIQQLKAVKNIKHTYIISGDSVAPTQRLAGELGIDHYFAQTLPEQKAALIEKLQRQGHFICYVGDGINDSIALKQAQVSISLAGASKIATDTAQIILMDGGISHLPLAFDLAADLNRHMNTQLSIVIGISICSVSGVFLAGLGINQVMSLNIFSLVSSLGYALIDKPTKAVSGNHR